MNVYKAEKTDFATRLAAVMKDRGLNQTHLQEKILEQSGKTLQRQTISLYMRGQSKPDTERLTLLCRALDVSADYLLGLSEVKKHITEPGKVNEREVLQDALYTFGPDAQMKMLLEEMSELQKEVRIMLDQMEILFGLSDAIAAHRQDKLQRLHARIFEAKYSGE